MVCIYINIIVTIYYVLLVLMRILTLLDHCAIILFECYVTDAMLSIHIRNIVLLSAYYFK